MSIKAMSRVWELDLPRSKQGVMLAMTDHGDDEGASMFPSTGLIAWKIGLSERQVQRLIRELEAEGILVLVAEAHGYRPVEYRVDWSAAKEKAKYDRKERRKARERRGVNLTPQDGRHDDAPSEAASEPGMSPPGATFSGERGDTQMSPRTLEPPGEPPTEEAGKPASSSEDRPSAPVGPRDDLVELSERLAEGIRVHDPKADVKPKSKGWLEPLRKLIDLDRRTVEEVRDVIDWLLADEFEHKVVLSPAKLRKRFTELAIKMRDSSPATPIPEFGGRRTDGGNNGLLGFRRGECAAQPRTFGAEKPPIETVAAGECPTTAELAAIWKPMAAELRPAVGEATANIWLASLHLHESTDAELVVGCRPENVSWVRDRFGGILVRVAGKPVRLAACTDAAREMGRAEAA